MAGCKGHIKHFTTVQSERLAFKQIKTNTAYNNTKFVQHEIFAAVNYGTHVYFMHFMHLHVVPLVNRWSQSMEIIIHLVQVQSCKKCHLNYHLTKYHLSLSSS